MRVLPVIFSRNKSRLAGLVVHLYSCRVFAPSAEYRKFDPWSDRMLHIEKSDVYCFPG